MKRKKIVIVAIMTALVMVVSILAVGPVNSLDKEICSAQNLDTNHIYSTSDIELCNNLNTNDPNLLTLYSIGEVSKTIWDGTTSSWVDSIDAVIGETLMFNITIVYEPTGSQSLRIYNIEVNDSLPSCLTYNMNSAVVLYDNDKIPGQTDASGNWIFWNLSKGIFHSFDISLYNRLIYGYQHNSNSVTILFDATVVSSTGPEGEQNQVNVKAYETCYHHYVYGADTATVNVSCPPPCEPGIGVEKYVKWDCTPPFKKNVTASIGDWVIFKLYVNNTGDIPLDIYVRDEIPSGLSYVTGSTDITGISVSPEEPEISGNYLYWNFTNVPSGTSIVITFRADVDECGEHINVVNVTGEYECQEYIYDEDTAIVWVPCPPGDEDLTVEKYVKWDCTPPFKKNVTASIGDWVIFKLYVNNTGDIPLDIYVRDEIPSGLSYVTGSTDITGISVSPEEPEISGNYLYWNFTNVPSGTSIVITFRADVDECGEHINVVNVTGEYECQEYIYDEDTAIVWVPCPPGDEDLTVEKYVKWDCTPPFKKNVTASIGDWVIFKLYVNNTGDIPLDIYVRDELPSGLSYVTDSTDITGISVSPEEPEISGNYLYWNFTNVPSGTSIVITFRADVDECGEHINVVNVTGEYECQEYIYDEDTAIVYVPCDSGINVEKKVSLDNISWFDEVTTQVGDILYFKINVSNMGDETTLSGVTVVDYLPSFLKYNYDGDPSPYYETDHQIKWFFPDIYAHEYKILTFTADVIINGTGDNVANATACGGSPSDEDNVTIHANSGINVEKKVSLNGENWVENVTASVGDTVRFNITISYCGPHTLFHINVTDKLPPGLEYANNAVPVETGISGNTIFWNLTELYLTNGSSTSIEFNATVLRDGEHVNIVNVTAMECSGTAMYDEDDAVVYVESGPSMECEKQVLASNGSWVDEINALVGDTVKFNITVSNIGYQPIYGIDILDTLPACLSYVKGSAVIKYNGETIDYCLDVPEDNNTLLFDNLNFCTGEYLSPGEIISLLFNANVIEAGIGVNLANVTACKCSQCARLACSDTATVNATNPVPDLVADASGSPKTIDEGDSVSFAGSATGGVPPYQWDWDFDDGTSHSTKQNPVHQFNTQGQYTVTLTVTDDNNNTDTDTVYITVNKENTKPNKPSKPAGETNGKKGVEYTYITSATDPDGDQLRYQWDWGDGDISDWSGLYSSGATATASHTWEEKGSYAIKVRVKDPDDLISDWSDPLPISMPNRYSSSLFIQLLEKLIERFPLLERILLSPLFL